MSAMIPNTFPSDPILLEQLAQIIDRARVDNGVSTNVSRVQMPSDIADLFQEIFATKEAPEGQKPTPWEMIAEEFPTPTRRYKIFAKALAADDPLTTLRFLSRDRSPSEIYILQTRIKSFARSRLPKVEKSLLDLQATEWSQLSEEQQANIREHMAHLETYYYKTQKRNTDPMENRINLAVHELANIFAHHTHFDGIPTDLPYTATSRFIQFVCLALSPVVDITKLSPDAVSMRWRRLKGRSISQ